MDFLQMYETPEPFTRIGHACMKMQTGFIVLMGEFERFLGTAA
jgi:hypothetical protein